MQRLLVIAILAAAAGAARADGPQDRCEIHVTGDSKVDASVTAPRDRRAITPGLSSAIGYWAGASAPGVFLFSCDNDQAHLTVGVAGKPTAKDVPFAPKKYAIEPDHDARPGDFAIMFSAAPAGQPRAVYRVSAPGTLDVTAFDTTHIAGTFHFTAKGGKGTVTVDGSFDLGCKGISCK